MDKKSNEKLSLGNKTLYGVSILLCVICCCLAIPGWIILKRNMVFLDSSVVSYCETPWIFLLLLPFMCFFALPLCIVVFKYRMAVPIWTKGNKNKSKFAKNKIAQNNRRTICTFVCVVIFINCICLFLPMYSRTVLLSQGDIIEYSAFNEELSIVHLHEYNRITLTIQKQPNNVFTVQKHVLFLTITDHLGKDYRFDSGAFRNVDSMLVFLEEACKKDKLIFEVEGGEYSNEWLNTVNLTDVQKARFRLFLSMID